MANDSEAPSQGLPRVPLGVNLVEIFTLLLLIFFGLLGNFCVCVMVYRTQQLRTMSNYLIVNLSVSDLMRVLFTLPLSTGVLLKRRWIGGNVLCQINGFYTLAFLSSSLLSVTLISVNRYFLVVRPSLALTVFCKRNTKLMIVGLWCWSVIMAFPPLLGLGRYGFFAARATCFIALGSANSYTSILVVILIAAPFSVMIWCYVKVYLEILASKKRVLVNTAVCEMSRVHPSQLPKRSKEIKVAKTVLILVGVYIITWIPVSILHFVRVAGIDEIPFHVDLGAGFLISLSCVTNPWIYGFKHTQFRDQLRSLFCMFENCGS